MAPTRKTSERQTRNSRAASPYSGRPNRDEAAQPKVHKSVKRDEKAKFAENTVQQPTGHRYGLRGMLSNLIWGSPTKSGQDEREDSEQQPESKREVQTISSDESEDDEDNDEEVSRRLTAKEKGKGRVAPQVSSAKTRSTDQPY